MTQYDVWAIVRKDSIETVGGEIINAYCTCTTGLLGSCNYVAGLLFRIEAAVLLGHTHQTCTSQLSQWNIPSHKKQIEPGEVASFIFEKETYMKKATQLTVNKRKQRAKLKMNFQVTSNSQAKKLADSANIRSELYNEVSDIIPRSCFTEFMETERKKHKRKRVESVPTSLECAESFKDCCDTELQP